MSASCVKSWGLVCKSTFNFEETCRWESWRVPERAKMRGMKSSGDVGGGVGGGVLVEGERGCVGMRQVRGASLWM